MAASYRGLMTNGRCRVVGRDELGPRGLDRCDCTPGCLGRLGEDLGSTLSLWEVDNTLRLYTDRGVCRLVLKRRGQAALGAALGKKGFMGVRGRQRSGSKGERFDPPAQKYGNTVFSSISCVRLLEREETRDKQTR